MTGSDIECPSNLKIIHDINLKINYSIPVISGTDTYFTLDVEKSDGTDEKICNVPLAANELKII